MGEFDFIQTYLAPLAGREGLGLLDDAALLSPPLGRDLVITQDTMVEGVHFPSGQWGAGTAEKLLRVNLSDLAAKGATPWGYFLSLSLPRAMDERWLSGFAKGLEAGQQAFDWHVMGGDTTRIDGPLVISLTAIGTVPSGKMVKRSGASIGDIIYVTGTIGDAMLGLDLAMGRAVIPVSGQGLMVWEEAYQRPEPRLFIRKWLRDNASASIDVSDGLLADAQHIASASNVGLTLNLSDIHFSAPTREWAMAQDDPQAAMVRLITAGDDYEILFTSAANVTSINSVSVTAIGIVTAEGSKLLSPNGVDITPAQTGYRHF
ncbi:thiamine-phosphate kinase [Robiginitomaculum antarcticum]|uniref:thiamine-phosphate kinase n=1 Tax=Robiginitomaculum antarcticum TaxID=437507 RepID=UPI00036707F4|nr:thiamine-phosphate kinase [Robiginitomaculum antarcticum]